jgi:Zn finger protein HypA/HybF involved in hydrogenase expression
MSNHRVVICEFCAGETDDGECPVCEGTRLAVIETQEIEISDLDAMEPVS